MRSFAALIIAAPLALAACAGGRLQSPDQLVVSISPALQARIELFCDPTLVIDNLATIKQYAALYNGYVQPRAPEQLPVVDVDDYTSQGLVTRVLEVRQQACDLYAAGQLFGAVTVAPADEV